MNKKNALMLSLLATALIFSDIYIANHLFQNSRERITVGRIIDGDTLELDDGRIIRLLNINSPEKGVYGFEYSMIFLRQFENKTLELEPAGNDKYKRILGRIFHGNIYLNLEMVRKGLSSKYMVHSSELSEFANAEKSAVSNSLGIWRKSEYFGCFDIEVFPRDERVRIVQLCGDLNLSGWILKDESRKTFTFKDYLQSEVNLHSGMGRGNETDLFWNSKSEIWNNNRDTLYLFDSKGGTVHHEAYGY